MRIYEGKYLSVTSIIELKEPFDRSSFIKWCESNGLSAKLISNTSRIIGNKVSEHLENIYRGLEWLSAPCVDDLEVQFIKGAEQFAEEYTIEATEQEVFCDELSYAGRFDGIVSKDGKRYLADWKTYGAWKDKPYKRDSKKIKKARQQLSLYAHALDWKDKIAVVVFKNDGTWDFEELKFDQDIIDWVVKNQNLILETIQNEKTKEAKTQM
jgi:hypothetical protein